jgi:hypothetical protein
MSLGEDTTITIGLAILLLGLMWRIAHLVASSSARQDAAETRLDLIDKLKADHEARIRQLERASNPTQHRRRATD